MGIQVVRFEHQSWRPWKDPEVESDELERAVLLFDPRLERGAENVIGDRFRRLDAGPRAADLLVIRGSDPDIREKVEADSMLADIRRGRQTMVLAPQELGREPTLQEIAWSEKVVKAPPVESMREAEILCGLNFEQAIYKQTGVHYLMPNARYHAEAFVRLGDSLNDQIDLIRLSDWLIARVDEHTALLADNGSMLPLLTTLALRVHQIHGREVPIATLDEYPVTPTAITTLVDRLRVDGEERLLFCVSVSSSGRVAKAVADLPNIETEAAILCETGKSDVHADGIARFSHLPVESWRIGEDGRCDRCNVLHLLVVSPRSYELRTAVKLQPESLDIKHAADSREFWEAAQEAEAVTLHVDAELAEGSPSPSRHLAVQIDVEKLLARSAAFREKCIEKLREISPPGLVLVPKHAASSALATLVGEAFPNLDSDKIKTVPIGSDLPDLKPLLEGVDHVLVVDDTLVSGNTLIGLRLALHDASVEFGGVDVAIFVPLSRPAYPENQHRVKRTASRPSDGSARPIRGGLHFAQELLLPERCPWCHEKELLERGQEKIDEGSHEFVAQRGERLVTRPLEPPLMPLSGETEGKIVGSFFGDLTPVPAFAAVSAHAQHLHHRIEQIRIDETIKVLDLPLLLQAFFDPIIVAALLRTLPKRDLRDPAAEHLVIREIETNSRSYSEATIAELTLAALDLKIPPDPVRKLLEPLKDQLWARSYLDLLEGF